MTENQILQAMEKSSGCLRALLALAGVRAKDAAEQITVIVPSSTMPALMYAARLQGGFAYTENPKGKLTGLQFGGITYTSKEYYDAYAHHGRS